MCWVSIGVRVRSVYNKHLKMLWSVILPPFYNIYLCVACAPSMTRFKPPRGGSGTANDSRTTRTRVKDGTAPAPPAFDTGWSSVRPPHHHHLFKITSTLTPPPYLLTASLYLSPIQVKRKDQRKWDDPILPSYPHGKEEVL